MPKITIDPNLCIGCNSCPLIAPDYFILDEKSNLAKVKKQPTKIDENIKSAVDCCPVAAISIEENEK